MARTVVHTLLGGGLAKWRQLEWILTPCQPPKVGVKAENGWKWPKWTPSDRFSDQLVTYKSSPGRELELSVWSRAPCWRHYFDKKLKAKNGIHCNVTFRHCKFWREISLLELDTSRMSDSSWLVPLSEMTVQSAYILTTMWGIWYGRLHPSVLT